MGQSSAPVPIATPSPKWGLLSGLLSLSMVQGGVIPIPRAAEAAAEMIVSHSLGSSPKTVVGFATEALAHSAPGPSAGTLSASPLRKSALSMAMGRETVAQRPPTGRSRSSSLLSNSGVGTIPRQPSRLTSEIAAQQQQLAQEQQRYLDSLMPVDSQHHHQASTSHDESMTRSQASAGTQMSFGSSSVDRKGTVSPPLPPLEAASVPGGYYFESDGTAAGGRAKGDIVDSFWRLEEEEMNAAPRKSNRVAAQSHQQHNAPRKSRSDLPPRYRHSMDGGRQATEPWERRPWGEAYSSTTPSSKDAITFEIGSVPGARVKMSPGL